VKGNTGQQDFGLTSSLNDRLISFIDYVTLTGPQEFRISPVLVYMPFTRLRAVIISVKIRFIFLHLKSESPQLFSFLRKNMLTLIYQNVTNVTMLQLYLSQY